MSGAGIIDRKGWVFIALVLSAAVLVPAANLMVPEGQPAARLGLSGAAARQISVLRAARVAVDLVWGYCGVLSLGHAAFFALGGYAMGMYLMRQIGPRGVYAIRSCRISWCS